MGNFRQHLKFSSTLGASYASVTWLLIGIDWLYGSIALLFSMLGGMLPDLDSDSGKEVKHLTSITAVFSALLFWAASGKVNPPLAFEIRVWITLFSAWFWSRCLRWFLGKVTVHRGMFHSIPTCFIWGSLMYLYYPHSNHWVRVYMASGIMVGYISHLLCDEYFSVESFAGFRVNKAFGTALKFWSGSLFSTFLCYCILGLCVKQVTEVWPKTKDGTYVAIGHPSESLDLLTETAKNRFSDHVEYVKKHGFIAWLEELLVDARAHVETKVDLVRENGLTKEGLTTSYKEIKEQTKESVKSNGTISAVTQIAVEAKATVSENTQVDPTVHANRPLSTVSTEPRLVDRSVSENLDSDSSKLPSLASTANGTRDQIKSLTEKATDLLPKTNPNGKTTKKPFQMEIYQPRRRPTTSPSSEPESLVRKPGDQPLIRIR